MNNDTTSHNFTWRIDTIGTYLSYFNDVAIFDENIIYAVGEINTDSGTYNLAIWNGNKWNLQDIDLKQPVNGIFNFSMNNIWAASGVLHFWNGNIWTKYHLWNMNVLNDSDGSLTSIWGNTISNIYFTGNLGTIVHYDGSSFQKMESGTDIRLRRISGNDRGNVFITGYELNGEGIALEISDGLVKEIFYSSGLPNIPQKNYGRFLSLWCGDHNVYFITTSGLLKVDLKTRKEILSIEYEKTYPFASHDIEGQAENDIIIISNRGKVVHWNGKSWSLQNEIYEQYPDHILTVNGADYNSETVVFVGYFNGGQKAFIATGKHIK